MFVRVMLDGALEDWSLRIQFSGVRALLVADAHGTELRLASMGAGLLDFLRSSGLCIRCRRASVALSSDLLAWCRGGPRLGTQPLVAD